MEKPYVLELKGLAKSFEGRRVVDDIDLSVRGGEFYSLLGSSGCGKSTTLRLIAGFERPDAGQILCHGRDITQLAVRQRDMNMVFQNYALFPHMTVFDNVAFGLRMQKKSGQQLRQETMEALALVQMQDFAKRLPSQLSGGQQQRVALARAIAPKPALLLLDEPLGALDQQLRKDMQQELKQLQRRLGIAFLFVTHDQDEALSLSEHLAIMSEGRILQAGTPEDIYEKPCNEAVAGFIGDVNLLDVTLESGGQRAYHAETGLSFRTNNPDLLQDASQARLVVRPEHWLISTEQPETPAFATAVEERHYLGRECSLRLRWPRGSSLRVTAPAEEWMQPGQTIWVQPKPGAYRGLLPSAESRPC